MKNNNLDYRNAQDMLERMQKAAFKIDGSQLDRNLSRKLTPPEQAGAYGDADLFHSCFDELSTSGHNEININS